MPSAQTANFGNANTNTSLAESSEENTVETVEITSFQDTEAPAISILPDLENTSDLDKLDNTFNIVEFLKRPVKILQKQLNVKTGNVVPIVEFNNLAEQPYIFKFDLPYDLIRVGNKLSKISNQYFMKADMHFKLTLNTNPFVGGKFYLTYSPYENELAKYRKQVCGSRSSITAYPGVEIDVQIDNSVEIVIPYSSYKEAYLLQQNPENFVTLYLFAITPILGNSSGQGKIELALYGWFDNIVINIPTFKTMGQCTLSDLREQIERLEDEYRIKAQMQVQAEAGGGPISSIASTVGSIATSIGNAIPIPVVSEVASAVSWVSNIVGSVASIFGWSRPTNMEGNTVVSNIPAKNYTHIEAIDESVVLGLSNRNELTKIDNVFPSINDEMQISYVCANPSIKDVVEWVSLQDAGGDFTTTTLSVIPVGIGCYTRFDGQVGNKIKSLPSDFLVKDLDFVAWGGLNIDCSVAKLCTDDDYYVQSCELVAEGGDSNNALLSPSMCEYVSLLFKQWRATMCFKISVVKTAFHAGRLEIFFEPGMYNTLPNSVLPNKSFYDKLDTTNNYKYILDITTDSEITIKIPFVSEKMFCQTGGLLGVGGYPTMQEVADSLIGSLVIRPLTNLMAPETVSPKVYITVWKWAEDVEFGVPLNFTENPINIFEGNHNLVKTPIKFKDISPKIIEDLKYVPVKAEMQINIGNKAEGKQVVFFDQIDTQARNLEACEMCLGEKIVNLRSLLRCFRKDIVISDTKVSINPQDNFITTENVNLYQFISYMYRFFRGGFRYKVIPKDGTFVESCVYDVRGNNHKLSPSHITFNNINPVHEISLPYYSKFRKLPINAGHDLMKVQVDTDAKQFTLLSTGNDDLTFGWLMGVPQIQINSGAVKWETYSAINYQPKSQPKNAGSKSRIPHWCKRVKVEMQINSKIEKHCHQVTECLLPLIVYTRTRDFERRACIRGLLYKILVYYNKMCKELKMSEKLFAIKTPDKDFTIEGFDNLIEALSELDDWHDVLRDITCDKNAKKVIEEALDDLGMCFNIVNARNTTVPCSIYKTTGKELVEGSNIIGSSSELP